MEGETNKCVMCGGVSGELVADANMRCTMCGRTWICKAEYHPLTERMITTDRKILALERIASALERIASGDPDHFVDKYAVRAAVQAAAAEKELWLQRQGEELVKRAVADAARQASLSRIGK